MLEFKGSRRDPPEAGKPSRAGKARGKREVLVIGGFAPGGDKAPGGANLGIACFIVGEVFVHEGPERFGVVEVDGMAELVEENIFDEGGGQKEEVGAEADFLARGAGGPAGF